LTGFGRVSGANVSLGSYAAAGEGACDQAKGRSKRTQTVINRRLIRINSKLPRTYSSFSAVKEASPSEAAGGRWPGLTELAKQNDLPEVIGIVSRQTFELLTNGHDADRLAWSRGTPNLLVLPLLISGCCSGLL
jgi:hypothetical protein